MTTKEMKIIEDNLRAYRNNFGFIKIEKENCGKGLYVYTSKERVEEGSWTQYCYNIDYLNGWLYGCVQAANGIMKKIKKPTMEELADMLKKAGHREKYAIDNGEVEIMYHGSDAHKCYRFTYSDENEYQDANGATYDTVRKTWIG